jgi:glycosyltransferase involved in cell wall biosynthesis
MRTTICLNMIVKNEARTIRRCLEAARPFIDTWVIVDTGSTDGTQDLIRDILKDLPGELHQRPWHNFGHNRSEAITLAEGKADFILLCDADMALKINDPNWRPDPARDGYFVRQHRESRFFSNIRLVNGRLTGDRRWCYRGSTHEFIDSVRSELNDDIAHTDAIAFWDHADGGSKADKYTRDATMLQQELERIAAAETTLPPRDSVTDTHDHDLLHKLKARATFYLAQTYRDMDDFARALDLYQARAALGGWNEELWFAHYQVAQMSDLLGLAPELVTHRYLLAYNERPKRAEPLVALARYHRQRRAYALAHLFAKQAVLMPEPDDILFIDRPTYAWQRYDEFAVASFWLDQFQDCAAACEKLLASGNLPASEIERVTRNLTLARNRLAASGKTNHRPTKGDALAERAHNDRDDGTAKRSA